VLIIDWDYHHGNGTQNAFYDDPSVLFFSTHDWQAYPGTGDPSLTGEGEGSGLNINAHLDCGARDVDMLRHWDSKLLSAVREFRPDFIIVSAGFDSRRDDLLGCFDLTDDVFKRMTRTAMDLADEYTGGRLVSLLEGGYNVEGSALAAAAHVETLLG
jgi:acetoin utilization deacetylase AcuC-like enzyme